jgi:hypothetical protein
MADVQKPIVIEQTEKKWKAWILAGAIVALLGLVPFFAMLKSNPGAGFAALLGCAFAGICIAMVGRIGGWWNHG